MVLSAVNQVECINGCGGGDPSALGVIGITVALLSTALAVYAVKLSKQSADSAEASLKIAKEQHEVFLREVRARATFDITIEVAQRCQMIETDANEVQVAWKVVATNTGDREARNVGMRFFAPREMQGLAWASTATASHKWGAKTRIDSAEVLRSADGVEHPTNSLHHEIDRINKGEALIVFVVGTVADLEVHDQRRLPGRFIIWSEDLADDVELLEGTTEMIVRRGAGAE
jgi:hypothetical protein